MNFAVRIFPHPELNILEDYIFTATSLNESQGIIQSM